MHIRSAIILASSLFLATIFFPTTASAIGFSPAVTQIENIRNGNSVERTIYISRAQPVKKEEYEVTIKGSAAGFIRPATNRIVLPAGKQQVPFVFFIEPREAVPGEYTAEIAFARSGKPEAGSAKLVVLSGSMVEVKVSVTDKVIDKLLIVRPSLDADTKEIGIFTIPFVVQNIGNIKAGIDQVRVSVHSETDEKIPEVNEIIPIAATVEPLSEKNFSVKLSKILPAGSQYTFTIDFLREGKSINTASFVRQVGQVAQIDIASKKFGGGLRTAIIYSGLFVVILGGLVMVTKKKKPLVKSRSRY